MACSFALHDPKAQLLSAATSFLGLATIHDAARWFDDIWQMDFARPHMYANIDFVIHLNTIFYCDSIDFGLSNHDTFMTMANKQLDMLDDWRVAFFVYQSLCMQSRFQEGMIGSRDYGSNPFSNPTLWRLLRTLLPAQLVQRGIDLRTFMHMVQLPQQPHYGNCAIHHAMQYMFPSENTSVQALQQLPYMTLSEQLCEQDHARIRIALHFAHTFRDVVRYLPMEHLVEESF